MRHWFGVCLVAWVLAGCAPPKTNVQFVVPDRFRGLIVVTAEPKSGLNVTLGRTNRVPVPASGRVELSSIEWASDTGCLIELAGAIPNADLDPGGAKAYGFAVFGFVGSHRKLKIFDALVIAVGSEAEREKLQASLH